MADAGVAAVLFAPQDQMSVKHLKIVPFFSSLPVDVLHRPPVQDHAVPASGHLRTSLSTGSVGFFQAIVTNQ
jgi:hypothetical protein